MSAKDFLRRNKTTIQSKMTGNRQLILEKCYETGIITEGDHINLSSINKGDEMEHVVKLVNNIMGKGEKRCKEFLDLLQKDEAIKEALPELNDILLKYTPSLPKPAQESSSTAKTDDVGQDSNPKPKDDDEPYPLKSKPTGLCFIINNVDFKDNKPRLGSDADAERLAKVFSWLGFRVLMCKDQTKDQMDQVLKCLSSRDVSKLLEFKVKEWSDHRFTELQEVPTHGDAFICCILTHGNTGVVLGTDKEHLAIKYIKKMFKATDLSPLTNKPKVFLIQACQGGALHGRVVLPNVQSDDLQPASIPEEADFLIGMSTVEDYESFRDPNRGSWYIQTVCKRMEEGCPSGDDMGTILRRVNNDVSQMDGWMEERPEVIHKQMPEIRDTLRKKLVFSPHSN
ncbi:caspase-8-like isoform X2 [Sphaeramia orbicularis]|uniref:caspase-8-like isoform X2 n=1 Tax=Sphaeramia orbicularis TaxID=375764 RepID=UPI00117E517D|nr:caspase-8-like isoform X2 [Sphaeramia orbicularis]